MLRLQLLKTDDSFPILVQNGGLLNPQKELREDAEVHQDYYLIPEALWEQMLTWNIFSVDCDIATVLQVSDL
jgi:hypothetical protein